MYSDHKICRACRNKDLIPVVDLGIQPLANDFCKPSSEHRGKFIPGEERAGYAPLKVLFCPKCTLAQLSVVVKPEILYSKYLYVTSPSATMQAHFKTLHDDLRRERGGDLGRVLEIGSNDGELLLFLKRQDVKGVMGVEPALNLSQLAMAKGIPTLTRFWNSSVAFELRQEKFDTIIARHVFCHVDDWHEFIEALAMVSHKDTLIAIEAPYAVDLLNHWQFDTIYHEHLSYWTLQSVEALLKDSPLKLSGMVHYPIHGGAALLLLRSRDFDEPTTIVFGNSVTVEMWNDLQIHIQNCIQELKIFVLNQMMNGHHIGSYGASAKSTVWISACGFDKDQIQFICDGTPMKQGRLSPGTSIPIIDEGGLMREMPAYCIVWPWNFRKELEQKLQPYVDRGGTLVWPPIPTA